MSEVLNVVQKSPEELDAEAKAKASAMGQTVLDKFETPEGIAYLQENANKDVNDPSYDATAAALTLFGLYGPHLMNMVDRLSNKQLRRLIKSLVMYPLEEIKPNKNNIIEVEAFKIADRLITSKYLVIMAHTFEEEQKRMIAVKEHEKMEEAKKVSEASAEELTKQE